MAVGWGWGVKKNPKGKKPVSWREQNSPNHTHTYTQLCQRVKKELKNKTLQEIFWIAKIRLKFKCSNKAKKKKINTIWKPLGLFVLFI